MLFLETMQNDLVIRFHQRGHRCLSVGIFGRANVVPEIDSFYIIHNNDALWESSDVSYTSVY